VFEELKEKMKNMF